MKQIELTQDKFAIVDDGDYEWLSRYSWHATRNPYGGKWYARGKVGNKAVYMHRLITGAPAYMEVNHCDDDTLNNQRHNLRTCEHSDSMRNRKKQCNNGSGYVGVVTQKRAGYLVYRAQIKVSPKMLHIGCFETPEEAARAYDKKAKELFGEFARLNFG